jgi:hypothetical protein
MKEKRKRRGEQTKRSEKRRWRDNGSDGTEAAGRAASRRRAIGKGYWQKGREEERSRREKAEKRKADFLLAKAAAAGSERLEMKSLLD